MIPSDPNKLKKLKELAERNIAQGDWGDEVSLPTEEIPVSSAERGTVSVLKKFGKSKLPKK